jgi:hypothetical protein
LGLEMAVKEPKLLYQTSKADYSFDIVIH